MGEMQEDDANDPDTALALAHYTFGRELDRICSYETSIVRAHARAVTELKKHIHTRISEAAPVQPAPQLTKIGSASQKLSVPTSHYFALLPIDEIATVSYARECPTDLVGDR